MQTLRRLHLYLGCASAPLILFFSISGFVQRLVNAGWLDPEASSPLLQTLHTGRALKLGISLSSGAVTGLVAVMCVSLITTTVLGVVLAFRFGHRRAALVSLLAGTIVPAVFVALAYVQSARVMR